MPRKTLSCDVSMETHAAFTKAAGDSGQSINAFLRPILEQFLLSTDGDNPPPAVGLEQMTTGHIHTPGLCDNGACEPCKASRVQLAQQVRLSSRKEVYEEMDAAAKVYGLGNEASHLQQAITKYRDPDAGKGQEATIEITLGGLDR